LCQETALAEGHVGGLAIRSAKTPLHRFNTDVGTKFMGDDLAGMFCLYVDGLLVALSKAGVGFFIGDYFVGALIYADDIVLLAPPSAVRVSATHYARHLR